MRNNSTKQVNWGKETLDFNVKYSGSKNNTKIKSRYVDEDKEKLNLQRIS